MMSNNDSAVVGLSKSLKKEIQASYSRWLAAHDYKPRYGQRLMIATVARALAAVDAIGDKPQRFAVVEAGTGIGKTVAYTLAAAPIAREKNKTLVISTATVALQEQLINKDLPDLIKTAELPLKFSLAKGRGRYLCLSKLDTVLRNNEEAGSIKHGSKMIQAVTNATVPQFTIYCGASFGAGNYGMCGRGFNPRFCFSWPNAKTAVMGGEQAAGTMAIVQEARAKRMGQDVDAVQLEALKAQIAALGANMTPGDGDPAASAVEVQADRIKGQLNLIDRQIKLIDQRQKEADARRKELTDSISRTPQVEIELSGLERKRADLQERDSRAVIKQGEAATGEKLEVNRQAERFVVIEQAQAPDEPEAPNRMLIAAGGSGFSIALGFGLALLLEIMSTSIRSAGDMQRRVELTPIVTVPYISTRAEVRSRRIKLAGLLLVLLVGVPAVLYAIDQYYMPLSALSQKMLDKTGLANVIQMIDQRF